MYGFHKLSHSYTSHHQTKTIGAISNVDVSMQNKTASDSDSNEKISYPPSLPQDRSLTVWYFTHPSGVFTRTADISNLEKIQRKSTGVGKDGKRKNVLSPVGFSYVDISKLANNNPPNINPGISTSASSAYNQSHFQYHMQSNVQKPFLDQQNFSQSMAFRHPYHSSQIPTPPPPPFLMHSHVQHREELPPRRSITTPEYASVLQPNGSIHSNSFGMQNSGPVHSGPVHIGYVQPPPASLAPHIESPCLTSGISPPNNFSLRQSASNPSLFPQSNSFQLSHPTPTRAPIVPAMNNNNSVEIISSSEQQMTSEVRYRTLFKAVLTLSDVVEILSQTHYQHTNSSNPSSDIELRRVSQLLQNLREELISQNPK